MLIDFTSITPSIRPKFKGNLVFQVPARSSQAYGVFAVLNNKLVPLLGYPLKNNRTGFDIGCPWSAVDAYLVRMPTRTGSRIFRVTIRQGKKSYILKVDEHFSIPLPFWKRPILKCSKP